MEEQKISEIYKDIFLCIIAEYGLMTLDMGEIITGNRSVAGRIFQMLINAKLIVMKAKDTKLTFKQIADIKHPENRPYAKKEFDAFMRITQRTKQAKENNQNKVVQNYANLVDQSMKILFKDLYDKYVEVSKPRPNIYKLTKNGMQYVSAKYDDTNMSNLNDTIKVIERSLDQLSIAGKLYEMGVEILSQNHDYTDPEQRKFIMSHIIKKEIDKMSKGSRALGVLLTPENSYVIHKDYIDGRKRFEMSNETVIIGKRIMSTTPITDKIVCITEDRHTIDSLETTLSRQIQKKGIGIPFKEFHILENNSSGLKILELLVLHDDWCIKTIERVFPGKDIDADNIADGIVDDKYVFVMVTNDYNRKLGLKILYSQNRMNDVVIICLGSQIPYYSSQALYKDAEIMPVPRWDF